ncbi:probable inactive receptor kinase At2g26730 [Corylus avellana]|uniref:probable inactive receptor kinase At2g26730 n=1 Tax=Corylus avellana TaxID=13451 RepID=UPI001E1F1B16|nr:probable inactive receptor kinase At2g26730 [Corylus avellana]
MAISQEEEVKQALVQFMDKLSPGGNAQRDANWGWNMTSDHCNWAGVTCYPRSNSVWQIGIEKSSLSGVFDASSVCMAKDLLILSLKDNTMHVTIGEEIGKCKQLTHLYLSGNNFSGSLPDSLSYLGNLKRLEISDNNFSGELPDLPRISGLRNFLAQINNLRGGIPNFDFSNFDQFNVSNNNFSGPIPDVHGLFTANSFLGNPGLCGQLVSTTPCPPAPPPSIMEPKASSTNGFLVYAGYMILGIVIVLFFAVKLIQKKKKREEKVDVPIPNNRVAGDASIYKPSETPIDHQFKFGVNRSEYSMTSIESSAITSTLVLLTSPLVPSLRFEDLLRAPAELLGRGKHGSLYKVMLDSGVNLAVKRIKDWEISDEDFRRRIQKIERTRHSNILPPIAFYCSKQEKLLVYEYQPNGSLFQLLHGPQNDHTFDWGSRLIVAASIAEALAYMHKELQEDGIAHGNLKSTNILFDKNMNLCVSEYGLMMMENQEESFLPQTKDFKNKHLSAGQAYGTFKLDVYGFGVILLELLTGKLVQNNGLDLATWVQTVVREEWTVEVFEKGLLTEGASEERMVNLLQIALKCINPSPNKRPTMSQVAAMIVTLKEEEESSISFNAGSHIYMGDTRPL